jgi:hypothetical protein
VTYSDTVQYVNAKDRARAGLLIVAMLAGCLTVWTLNPILWLWVGSQVDEGGPPSMTAIAVVVLGIVFTAAALAWLLTTLHRIYRDIRGARTTMRLRMPWLSSAGGNKAHGQPRELELTVLDVIVISSVLIAVGLYEYWFLFESGSPIDLRTGRE